MFDLHCHILPGVDDGPLDSDVAVQMAQILTSAGFHTVAASPHVGSGPGGDAAVERIVAARVGLAERLEREGVALKLLPNAENHLDSTLFDRIARQEVVPVGGASHWLLTEVPWGGLTDLESILFRLQAKGFRVLLAHPERLEVITPDVLERLVRRGVRMQLELGSFVGLFGDSVRFRAVQMAERGLVHVLATDLHHPADADRWLPTAIAAVIRVYGQDGLTLMTETNPKLILNDAPAERVRPFAGPG